VKQSLIYSTCAASLAFNLFAPLAAIAQLIPEPWVSVGTKDNDITYSIGARALDVGVELGTGRAGATGVDALKFINLPLVNRVSPYVGLGIYSGDENVAYSGGVQVNPANRLTLGLGYHSIRGVNGQVGIRF
jgi:hypothetical protein